MPANPMDMNEFDMRCKHKFLHYPDRYMGMGSEFDYERNGKGFYAVSRSSLLSPRPCTYTVLENGRLIQNNLVKSKSRHDDDCYPDRGMRFGEDGEFREDFTGTITIGTAVSRNYGGWKEWICYFEKGVLKEVEYKGELKEDDMADPENWSVE